MEKTMQGLMDKLYSSVLENDFIGASYNIVDEIEKLNNQFDAIEPILKLMELFPGVHFGNPGPLAHFVEKFYKNGYESKLLDSLARKPTIHTVWMLNRIINDSSGETKDKYVSILRKIADNTNENYDVRMEAQSFLE